MIHGVNKEAPLIVTPLPQSLPGFHQVCLLFYKKSTFFCSDQVIAKNNAFSK